MTTTADPARRFSADMLAGVDEPVRRYFTHTITDGAPLPDGVHMAMRGHIKVGLWLPFTAEQTVDGRSFAWRARVGRGPLTPLRVTDQYAGAAGSTEGRLLGRVTLFHAHDADTSTSLPSNPRSACASTTTVPYKRSALCVGATPAGRRSNTSLSEARSTPSAASATSCFPAAPASAGGSTPRATRRSSVLRSARSRQRSKPSHGHAPGRLYPSAGSACKVCRRQGQPVQVDCGARSTRRVASRQVGRLLPPTLDHRR
jgi:hypothetical protein